MMEFAQSYRDAGFSVIPLRPGSKIPAIKWEEYQRRLPTKAEVTQWFHDQPNSNIGLVTGEVSGFVVVDLDGAEGLATGKRLRLTSPVCVHTANGSHLYYRWNEKLKNSVKALPGLDIRGDGGQVAAPPSLHPNGKYYRWASSPLARHLLPDLPPSLLSMLVAAPSTLSAGNESGWIAKALGEMKHGNIDDTLFKICSRLRADGYSAEDTRLLLRPHADGAGATPGHLDDKIANVWSRYSPNVTAQPVESKSESLSDFLQDTQKVEWICEPIIAKKSIGFVAGLPETQKTWLLMDLAVEMCRESGRWIGLAPTTRAKVLFIDQERFKGETQRRFSALIAAKQLDSSTLSGLHVKSGSSIKINDDRDYAAFREELLVLRPDVVMVDSFATFHTVPENNRMDMQVVLDRIKSLRDEVGCAFVFINHESKSAYQDGDEGIAPNAFRMLGSVGIVAAAEFVLTVRRLPDGGSIVHHTKSTMASKRKSFFMSVVDTASGIEVRGVE